MPPEVHENSGSATILKPTSAMYSYTSGSTPSVNAFLTRLKTRPKPVQLDTNPMPNSAGPTQLGMTPDQIAAYYNYPTGDGEGQTIGILTLGKVLSVEDVEKEFTDGLGLPAPTIQLINVSKPDEYPKWQDEMDETETLLDIQVIGSILPKATLNVYRVGLASPNDGNDAYGEAIQRAADEGCIAFSTSWGQCEDEGSATNNIHAQLIYAQEKKMAVFASSGDAGTWNNNMDPVNGEPIPSPPYNVNSPCSDPNTICIGGTQPMPDNVGEVAWNELFMSPSHPSGSGTNVSTGGGVSRYFAKPIWQETAARNITTLNTPANRGRVVPDYAAVANFGSWVFSVNRTKVTSGGTSASTPLYAALYAKLRKQQESLPEGERYFGRTLLDKQPRLDVTVGNNANAPFSLKGYSATAGYDAVTGWGVISYPKSYGGSYVRPKCCHTTVMGDAHALE